MFVFFAIVAAALGVTAGITAGKLVNKAGEEISTIGGLLPAGSLDVAPNNPDTNKPDYLKIIIISVLGAIGILIVRFIGKKLHIKLFNKI
jgi:hypothetical protein